ncbi:hypothetical protein pb186bvf_010727 [Paramecium bursaria]
MFESIVPGLERKRWIIYICCYLQYTFVHSCRSTWSYVSSILKTEDTNDVDSTFIGYTNFAFLFVYGSAMLFLGQVGDKIGPKMFVLIGTFTTSIIIFMICILITQEEKHQWIFLLLMIANGVTQATAWPGLLAILNNWFSKQHKLILMGYFTSCTNIGNLIGDLFAFILIEQLELEVMSPMYLSAFFLLLISCVNVYLLTNSTKGEYIQQFKNSRTGSLIYQDQISVVSRSNSQILDNSDIMPYHSMQPMSNQEPLLESAAIPVNLYDSTTQSNSYALKQQKKKPPITMLTAWKLPNVALYAFAFGCIKAVYYIIAFWLPSYLKDQGLPNVALITSMIEIGTIPGGILVIYAGVYWDKRASIIVPFLWLGTFVMVSINFLKNLEHNFFLYIILVFLTGILVGGCYNNISGAIVIELSNMKELKGNKKSTSTVTSVVMGYGAVFAALNQLVVKYVEKKLFLYCGAMAVIGGVLLIPLIVNEIRRHNEKKKITDIVISQAK